MIKITFKEIRQGMFIPSFDRLCNNPNLPPKASYNVAKMAAKIRPAIQKSQDAFFKIVEKYAHKDEKGDILPDPKRGPGSFTIMPEHEKAYETELVAFDAEVVEIDRFKLNYTDLASAKLAPNEWLGLEPILAEEDAAVAEVTPIKNAK